MSGRKQVNLIHGLGRQLDWDSLIQRAEQVVYDGRADVYSGRGFDPSQLRPLIQQLSSARNELVRYANRYSPEDIRQSGREGDVYAMISSLDRNYRELTNLDWFYSGNMSQVRDEAKMLAEMLNQVPSNYFSNPERLHEILPRVRQLIPQVDQMARRFGWFGLTAFQLRQLVEQIEEYREAARSPLTDRKVVAEWLKRRVAMEKIANKLSRMFPVIDRYLHDDMRDIYLLDELLEEFPVFTSTTPYLIRVVTYVRNQLNDLTNQLVRERGATQLQFFNRVPRPLLLRAQIQEDSTHFLLWIKQILARAVRQHTLLNERKQLLENNFNLARHHPDDLERDDAFPPEDDFDDPDFNAINWFEEDLEDDLGVPEGDDFPDWGLD